MADTRQCLVASARTTTGDVWGPTAWRRPDAGCASADPGAVASMLTQARAQGWATATRLEPTAGDRPTGLAALTLIDVTVPGSTAMVLPVHGA